MIKSVYIHIPFCKNICNYCDFCKLLYKHDYVAKYLIALDNEITTKYNSEKIKTLYVGGGTPSSLNLNELNNLFNIIKKIKLAKNYEFTFECNINDINIELLKLLKKNNVNRISIGIESFNKKILDNLGRKEKPDVKKIELVKQYFKNINLDLMYGANNETVDDLKTDLEIFLSLNIPHISIYSLIIEDNTILKINNYQELDEDLERTMYDYIVKILQKHNYIHYEISNFAKKGYASKHNLTYWNNEEYYGFGLGAGGFVENFRYTNTRNINKYINNNYLAEGHNLSVVEDMENEMILGLRKIKGVSKKKFYNKYHKDIKEIFKTDLLQENKTNYYVARKNLYVENYILEDFIISKSC